MNPELELDLQSYLDGELTGRGASRVEQLLASNPEAQALFQELKVTKQLLGGNELAVKLPETREFYWSKIQRGIEQAEKQEAVGAARAEGLWGRWKRYLAPMAGVAVVVTLGVMTAKMYDATPFTSSTQHLAEIQNLSDHTGSYSFRSQSENMFVVWVYDRDQEIGDITEAGEPEAMPQ
jgi:anti-sigma factor RsiW